jgi:DnaJ-domain-containing protein 1
VAAPDGQLPRGATQAEAAFEALFGSFQPAPDDTTLLLGDGNTAWWDVLGVARNADRRTIENAYKALARIHHPDLGGSADSFVRLRRAYEAAIKAAA